MSAFDDALVTKAVEDRRKALDDLALVRKALLEVVRSLVPRYDPDHPEDHGFSEPTAVAIRAAMKEKA